ncbi:LOW QUALITY PROTEIN: interleukin-1 receptor accessory protein [Sceloporus undulatus]|uniref:LOW QUALITY PROTEIN: interleukin-1 receptor accessory protein n=1 Tax=Sceloporus undulatus TaxID=8520 RepID=UPI001C4C474E|nr:LOW QUALITY PROTEIN: interleukin-1 receptor accessory protein [Sceloporus undulatus]
MKLHHLLLVAVWLCISDLSSASERCDDWGVDTMKHKPVYNGELAKIRCPLFEAFVKYNYSTAHSSGLTLIWYWIGRGQDLEEPINFRLPDNHISKEKDTLWFRPALFNDTGNYTCMLRNTSYCSKVAFPLEVVNKDPGSCVSQAVKPEEVLMYLSYTNINLTCPDVEGFYPAHIKPKFHWYKAPSHPRSTFPGNSSSEPFCTLVDKFHERKAYGINLTFFIVRQTYYGDYTCIATYRENGRDFNLTRTFRVKVVAPPSSSTAPQITTPNNYVVYEYKPGADIILHCEVIFTFLKDSPQEVWWTIDGKNTDEITELKFNISQREAPLDIGSVLVVKTLFVSKVTEKDLKRNYTCFAHNNNGTTHMQAWVRMKVPVPRYTVELACGLGATILLVVILTVIYHAYWLEMVLFYRAHFGTDETILDGKEYDIYVSYARNAEEEEFVLLTLRGVLENEFGYKLCIFDRDSLPGGIVTDETLSFIQRSRRLLVVLSPNYVLQGTQALLELKAGLEDMASRGTIKVILVQYRAVKRSKVKELRQAKAALTVIKWKGEKSSYPRGRFWKRLLVEMPIKSRPKSVVKVDKSKSSLPSLKDV